MLPQEPQNRPEPPYTNITDELAIDRVDGRPG